MKSYKTKFEKVKLLKIDIFRDKRGFFYENFNQAKYQNFFTSKFIQDNISFSKKNVIRGLHFQSYKPQSQLLTLIHGKIFDVIVDLRKNSKTFKKWLGFNLDHKKINQIYMPPGVAHGFCVLSDFATIHYKVSKFYDANNETGIRWNDKTLNINWPIKKPIISSKDNKLPYFEDIFKAK